MRIKENKWRDGKQLDKWPQLEEHIGWSVETAGFVNLDLEESSTSYNNGKARLLPPRFPMILKDIRDGMAYGYNHIEGVIRIPVELLRPCSK